MTKTKTFRIPEGWTMETGNCSLEGCHITLVRPEGFSVTVDFEDRCFRGGHTYSGASSGPRRRLRGRSWQQALVNAAVEWLEAV